MSSIVLPLMDTLRRAHVSTLHDESQHGGVGVDHDRHPELLVDPQAAGLGLTFEGEAPLTAEGPLDVEDAQRQHLTVEGQPPGALPG